MGLRLLHSATSCILALALTAPYAAAQGGGAQPTGGLGGGANKEKQCKFVTAKRGDSAEIVPNDDIEVADLDQFKFFLGKQSGLLKEFQIDKEDEDRCIAAIPVFNQAAQAAGVAAGAAAAAGVAPATLAAGSIAGSLGLAGVGALVAVGAVVGTVAVTSGGSTTSTVNTVDIPPAGPQ